MAGFSRGLVEAVLAEWERIGFRPVAWVDHARNRWNIATYLTATLARSADAADSVVELGGAPNRPDRAPRAVRGLAAGDLLALAGEGSREIVTVAPTTDGRAVRVEIDRPFGRAVAAETVLSLHPAAKPVAGAVPDSPHYCADLTRRAGIKAFWTWLPPDLARATCDGRWGFASTLTPMTLPDGSAAWGLLRCYERGQTNNTWLGRCLRRALEGDERSDGRPMDPDTYMIVATHLGYGDADGRPDDEYVIEDDVYRHNGGRWFNEETVAAFRALRAAQDAGRVLVARTDRPVRYNLVHDALTRDAGTERGYTAHRRNGVERIDVHSVDDLVSPPRVPSVGDLRGITFYCEDPWSVQIRVAGRRVPDGQVQSNPPDHTRRPSIGIRWHPADRADHTAGARTIDRQQVRSRPRASTPPR
jgi:hypothetical protein